jgi:hypothetical protein
VRDGGVKAVLSKKFLFLNVYLRELIKYHFAMARSFFGPRPALIYIREDMQIWALEGLSR